VKSRATQKQKNLMWSWLDSVDAVSTASSIARWVGAIVAIVILILGHRLSALQSLAKSNERKAADEQIAAARAQAEEAKKLAADLEAKGQPRILTPEQHQMLRDAMFKEFSGGLNVPIVIASKMLDPECESYAQQISKALPIPKELLGLTTLGAFTFQGVRIFAVGDIAAESVEGVRRAFNHAGIPFSTEPYQSTSSPIHPDVGVFIFVGYK